MTVFVGSDTAKTRRTLEAGGRSYAYYSIEAAEQAGLKLAVYGKPLPIHRLHCRQGQLVQGRELLLLKPDQHQ